MKNIKLSAKVTAAVAGLLAGADKGATLTEDDTHVIVAVKGQGKAKVAKRGRNAGAITTA